MKRLFLPLASALLGLLACGLALAVEIPAPTAAAPVAPAVGLTTSGKTTTKASEMDCGRLQDKTLGDLQSKRTEPEEIANGKCKLNMNARANDDETVSIGTEKIKGACQATYDTINYYADTAQKKLDEVCEIVKSAHELRSDCGEGQKSCVSALAAKDRAAAAKLKELTAILKQAQKDLVARRKTLKAVADKYKRAFAKIDEAIQKAGPNGNLQSTLTGVPNDVFSPDASNGWTALSSNGFDGAKFSQDYSHYSASVDPAFDPDANAVPLGLGHYTNELVNANGAATEAIKTVDTAVPRVASVADHFEQRADNLTGTSTNLGSIESASSLTGNLRSAGAALGNASGASRMAPVAAGLAGIAAAGSPAKMGSSPGSLNGATAPTPDASADASGAPIAAASLDPAATSATPPSASGEAPASAEAAKRSPAGPNGELFTNFGSLGPVSGGDDYDVRMAQTKAQRSGTYVPAASRSGASSEEPVAVTAAGDRNSPASAAAPQVAGPSKPTPTTDVAALREALRKRLAERTKHGDDADASAAVDELLYAAQDRKPAAASGLTDDAGVEQAGPQARESEPLFQRVHHAHRRFQSRWTPRSAGL